MFHIGVGHYNKSGIRVFETRCTCVRVMSIPRRLRIQLLMSSTLAGNVLMYLLEIARYIAITSCP